MPIYVYECASCGERFEYTQSLSEPPKTVCETCGGKLDKIIAPTAFHLKGGGWYKDLYSSSPKSGGGSGGGEKKSETKTETKGETKSESKTESKPSGGGDK